MLDWLGGFNATKLKPQLKMAVQRINLVKNKKTNQVQPKAKALGGRGKGASARGQAAESVRGGVPGAAETR